MSKASQDNKRPVEAFGPDFSSMGVYDSAHDAAQACLARARRVGACCRCAAPRSACMECPLFKKHQTTFRWADG